MHASSRYTSLIATVLTLAFLPAPQGYFGLTSRESLSYYDVFPASDRERNQSRVELCDSLHLSRHQGRMCRRSKGVGRALLEALRLASHECALQFNRERWNCSLRLYRQRILRRGFKETAFLYAVSSAAMVHAFASACSRGSLDRCTCDEWKRLENTKAWMWGGCGHNIRFGLKYTRKFLRRGRRSEKDIRAQMDEHNRSVGIKIVKDQVRTVCKCHGVSGSCTMRSCWRQLAHFNTVAKTIKKKYDSSQRVIDYANHAGNTLSPVKGRKAHLSLNTLWAPKGNLVFVEKSPNFCYEGRYSPGTRGRECTKGGNCRVMCCGRGYNVQYNNVERPCKCQVIWCCKVNCETCVLKTTTLMCK